MGEHLPNKAKLIFCQKMPNGGNVITGFKAKSRIVVCIGLALNLLIATFTLWGALPLSDLTGLDISNILKYWSIPLLCALGLMLILVFLKRSLPSRRFLVGSSLLSGVLVISGYVLLYAIGKTAYDGIFAVVASAVSIGLGCGLLLLLWQHQLSRFSEDEVSKTLLISLAGSSSGFLLMLPLLNEWGGVLFVILVVVSVILSVAASLMPWVKEEYAAKKSKKKGREKAIFEQEKEGVILDIAQKGKKGSLKDILFELRDSLFCVSAIAVAVALTRAIALDGMEISDSVGINIASNASIIIVSLVLYIVWFGFDKKRSFSGKQNIPTLYRVFFPVIATALLLLSVFGNALGLIVTTLVYAAFAIVSTFIMSTSITIARKYDTWSPYVYGIFAGCMYFVFALATSMGVVVYYPKNFGAATYAVIVLLVLYILAMSYFAIQNRRKKSSEEMDEGASGASREVTVLQETTVIDEVAQRCNILADRHQITAREKDILLLIAKGRDVPSVAKQLFISENTVRSHSKNVYRKLGIHSKQELLDLLETILLEDQEA